MPYCLRGRRRGGYVGTPRRGCATERVFARPEVPADGSTASPMRLWKGCVSRFIKYGYVLLGRSPAVFLRVVPKRLHVITTQHFEQFGASVQKAFVPRRPSIG